MAALSCHLPSFLMNHTGGAEEQLFTLRGLCALSHTDGGFPRTNRRADVKHKTHFLVCFSSNDS